MNSTLQILLLAAVVMAFSTSTAGAYRVRRAPVDRTGSGDSGQQGGGTTLEGSTYGWSRLVNSQVFQEEAFVGSNKNIIRMRSLVSGGGYTTASVLYDFEESQSTAIVKPGGYYSPCFVYTDTSLTFSSLSNEVQSRAGKVVSSAISLSLQATKEPLTQDEKNKMFNDNPMVEAVCGYPESRLILMMETPDPDSIDPTEPTEDIEFFTATSDVTVTVYQSYMQ